MAKASQSRCSAPNKSPRFQASSGPTATAIRTGTLSRPNTRRHPERRTNQPRQKRGVHDRIQAPPPAPAERVIGPPASHRDADGERAPRNERPGPYPPSPSGIDAALDEGGNRERERNRE